MGGMWGLGGREGMKRAAADVCACTCANARAQVSSARVQKRLYRSWAARAREE